MPTLHVDDALLRSAVSRDGYTRTDADCQPYSLGGPLRDLESRTITERVPDSASAQIIRRAVGVVLALALLLGAVIDLVGLASGDQSRVHVVRLFLLLVVGPVVWHCYFTDRTIVKDGGE